MLRVFICEDDKNQLNKINKYVENVIFANNLDMDISLATDNPYDILDLIEKNNINGIYFLDVDLNTSINGIEVAEKIREYDPRGFIIFITTHSELSHLTFKYKVEAMDYIIKDDHNEVNNRVRECILNAHKKYSSLSNTMQEVFTLESNEQIINVEYDKIIFFETSHIPHKVILHAINRRVEFYGSMKNIEEQLGEKFYRCHESFIVNTNNIKRVDERKRIIYMINGQECVASIRKIRKLKQPNKYLAH